MMWGIIIFVAVVAVVGLFIYQKTLENEDAEDNGDDPVSMEEFTRVMNYLLECGAINYEEYNELLSKAMPFVK